MSKEIGLSQEVLVALLLCLGLETIIRVDEMITSCLTSCLLDMINSVMILTDECCTDQGPSEKLVDHA